MKRVEWGWGGWWGWHGGTRVFSRFNGHIPVCSQTYHGPQIRAVSHRAAAGKRKASLSAWEKWERRKERKEKKRNVAKKVIRVWSCKDRSLLMWNSCRGGGRRAHFLCPSLQKHTLWRQHVKPTCGASQVLSQAKLLIKHLLLLFWWERASCSFCCSLAQINNSISTFAPPWCCV